MKVIRYTNGKKVQELDESDETPVNPAVVPAPVKKLVKRIAAAPQPQPAQPSKGCGCGR
jgi:hypothetical protein